VTYPVIPAVTVRDGPVPDWAPEAIRGERRRPAGLAGSWPAAVPRSVLALRLVGSRLPLLRPAGQDGAVALEIDGEAVTGVDPDPTFWTAATPLTPGRHTLTFRAGTGQFGISPVILDVREGTVVVVDVTPPKTRWFDQRPPAVTVRVVPDGFSQAAIRDALLQPVSPGSRAERAVNAMLARADDERADNPRDDSPWPAPAGDGSVPAGALTALASARRTWVGTARRRGAVRTWAGGFVFVAVFLTVSEGPGVLLSSPLKLGGLAGAGALAALLFVLATRPLTLTVDPETVTLAARGQRAAIALADLEWATLSWDENTLVLTPRMDARGGPKRTVTVDLQSFTAAQRDEILRLFRPCGDAAPEVPATAALPCRVPAWTREAQPKTWVSLPGVVARILWWALAAGWVAVIVAVTMGAADDGDPPWYVPAFFWASVVPLTVFMVSVTHHYARTTVTVDATGLRIDRAWRPCALGFDEISTITTRTVTVTPGLDVIDALIIAPASAYFVRTGTRPPGRWAPQWRLSSERFAASQFDEILAYLAQGVEAAGGSYYPG